MIKGGSRVALLTLASVLLLAVSISAVHSLFGRGTESDKPELHPTTLVLAPASPVEKGRIVKVHVKLENSGAAAADAFKVEFFLRARPDAGEAARRWTSFAVVEVAGLSPQAQEIEASAELDTSDPGLIPTTGVYEIRVVVDSNDQIPELDEGNNELITSLLVQPSKLGQPDLRPTALVFEPPSPVGQHDTVVMGAAVVNTGDQSAAPFEVSFAYCRISEGRSSCPGEFTEFDRARFEGGLPKGASQAIDATLDIPGLGLEAGRYLIRVTVDPPDIDHAAGRIEEQDEANNTLTAALFIQGPELHPTGLSFDPAVPHAGEAVKVTATVKNSGEGTAHKVAVAFLVDGRQFALHTQTFSDNEEATVEAFLKTGELGLGAGTHSVRVIVDPTNQIAERDETNNEIHTSLTLQPPLPRKPELRPKRLVFTPSSPVDLGTISSLAALVEVLNTGESEAAGVEVAFSYRSVGSVRWIPLPCSTNCVVERLPPGTRIEAKGELDLSQLGPGQYEIRAVVDPNDQIAELDEFNNAMQSSVTLLAARVPDLLIDPLSVWIDPPNPKRGERVRIEVEIANEGERASGPFTVEFTTRRFDAQLATVFGRKDLPGIEIGGRSSVEAALDTDPLRPGFYELRITVDADNRVKESDETNNEFVLGGDPNRPQQGGLFVRGPNLVLQSLNPADPNLNFTSPQITRGEPVELVAEIANIGSEAAGGFRVEFCARRIEGDGDCTDRQRESFPGLGQGGQVEARTVLDTRGSNWAPGTYEIRATVDPDDQVEEEVEQDNGLSLPFLLEVLPRPDLEVARIAFDPPSPVEPGTGVIAFADIVNSGEGPARRPFNVAFGLRPLGEERCERFDVVEVPAVPPGGQVVVKAQLPRIFSPGAFKICVTLDPEEIIPERNEDNNFATARFVVGLPDLFLNSVTFEPRPPVLLGQEELKIFADIRNRGEGPVIEPFTVEFAFRRISPKPQEEFRTFARMELPGLEAGGQTSTKAELDTSNLICGTYGLQVIVDPQNVITERNRENNRQVVRFAVCRPDLLVKQITFEPDRPLAVGEDELKIFADIRNVGDGPVIEPFTVEFAFRRISPEPREEFKVFARPSLVGLEAGAQAAAKVELDTGDLIPGHYEVRVTVDPENAIVETNEENNQLIVPFEILPAGEGQVDLAVLSLQLKPEVAFVGQTVQVKAQIANLGRNDAGPFRVVFFWRRIGDDRLVNFANYELGELAAGAQRTLTAQLDTSLLWHGKFEIIVVVDINDQVKESNEENNRASQDLTVDEDP